MPLLRGMRSARTAELCAKICIRKPALDSAMAFPNRMPQLANGCVLLDVSIPGMDGVELLGRMRPMKSRFLVIAATEQANIELAVRVMKAGAVDLIQKPFSDETILAAIHSALLGKDQAGSMRRAKEVADAYRKLASSVLANGKFWMR